jgi:hypothetical protein
MSRKLDSVSTPAELIDEFYIDYQKLADAHKFYKSRGYTRISVPWVVRAEAGDATKPSWAKPLDTALGRLPASGENSFLSMILEGKLPPGKYFCCTPCFRYEEEIDELHKYWFEKVELIDTLNFDFEVMLQDAFDFLSQYIACEIISFPDGTKDIVSAESGIELGSYGVRELAPFGKWAYGTGVAEPRLSYVIAKEAQLKSSSSQ